MKKHLLTLIGICLSFAGLLAQTGTQSNPFTTLSQARQVSTIGVYFFNLEGLVFSTRVDANGYVQVAVDFGNGLGTLPTSNALNGSVRGILQPNRLAKLGAAEEVRMSISSGTLNAVSTTPALVNRVVTNTTLKNGAEDNTINQNWTGIGSGNLKVNATTNNRKTSLAFEVFHTFGDGSGVHWYPNRGDQALTFNNDIAANESIVLWVRGAPYSPPGGVGTVGSPFTTLARAHSVTTPGNYFFNLNGVAFSALVDANGYVQLAVDYGNGIGALPQGTSIPQNSRGILQPSVLATLTDATQIRMTSSVPGTLEATTTNNELLRRIRNNQTLKNRPADNQFSTDWVGTGSNSLRIESSADKPANQLHREIFHTNGDGSGMTWFPERGDQGLQFRNDIPANDKFTLWVRAAAPVVCRITLPVPTVVSPVCPAANTGSITATASCNGCTAALEYSRNGTTYQASNRFNNLGAGTYTIYVRQVGGQGCSQTRTVALAPGRDNTLPALPALNPLTLTACKGQQTVPAPTVQDNCSGTVTATTNDRTTFSASGDYTIRWRFDDGNGNVASKTQQVKVYGAVLNLPFVESVEAGSPTSSCWNMVNAGGAGSTWREFDQESVAHSGSSFFVLLVDNTVDRNAQLYSPNFTATANRQYSLDYAYRQYSNGPAGDMQVVLVNAGARTIVKTLSVGKDSSNVYRELNLLFDVPQTGTYFVAFLVTTPAGGRGFLLDDIAVKEHAGPVGGAADLLGSADDACTTIEAYDLNGSAYSRFLNASGKLAMEIDPNGNDLGDVTVEMRDYAESPFAPSLRQRVLSRHFNISPTNGSGPYLANGGVKIRLFFTAAELSQLSAATQETLEWEDIIIYHYSDVNEDCEVTNSTGSNLDFEDTDVITQYGGTAYGLTFTVTSFSEFGGTTNLAASGLPVTLRSFTAAEEAENNRLEWQADQEIDFSHYTVERSTDGVVFSELVKVTGVQQNDYFSIDPVPASLTYYRLKMVDFDGTFDYSKVVSVSRDGHTPFAITAAFPMPARDLLTLRFTAFADGPIKLRLADGLGQIVRRSVMSGRAGLNEELLDLSGLPLGSYHLTLNNGKELRTIRLVKQ